MSSNTGICLAKTATRRGRAGAITGAGKSAIEDEATEHRGMISGWAMFGEVADDYGWQMAPTNRRSVAGNAAGAPAAPRGSADGTR